MPQLSNELRRRLPDVDAIINASMIDDDAYRQRLYADIRERSERIAEWRSGLERSLADLLSYVRAHQSVVGDEFDGLAQRLLADERRLAEQVMAGMAERSSVAKRLRSKARQLGRSGWVGLARQAQEVADLAEADNDNVAAMLEVVRDARIAIEKLNADRLNAGAPPAPVVETGRDVRAHFAALRRRTA